MDDLIEPIRFWHWWILGLALAGIEIVLPGTYLLWLGIAAGLTGALLLVAPGVPWQWQVLVFAVLSVASVLAWRAYQRRHPTVSADTTLNRRGEQYVGRVFALEEAIVNGRGTIHVDDSRWLAAGPDLPVGARVRVVGVAGAILKVEPAGT